MADELPAQAGNPGDKPGTKGDQTPAADGGYEVLDTPAPKSPPLKIDKPSVLEGFPEDADFDQDPEVRAAQATAKTGPGKVMPNPLTLPRDDEADAEGEEILPGNSSEPLIRPSSVPPKAIAAVGAILAIAAGGLRWYTAEGMGAGLPLAALTIYFCLLHAVTGLVAVVLMSLLQRRPAGMYALGAARMLVAVSLFFLLAGLKLPLGLSFVPAAAGYLGAVMILFKVRPNVAVQIAGIHGAIWLAVHFGFWIQEMTFGPTKGEP